jgi:hypothetical protein
MPFCTVYSIGVFAQSTLFHIKNVVFTQITDMNLAILTCERVGNSIRTKPATIKHLLVLSDSDIIPSYKTAIASKLRANKLNLRRNRLPWQYF